MIYALALQRICIASNSGHISDLLYDISGTALIKPNNPEELATVTLAMTDKKIFIDSDEITQLYSVENQLKNWLNIYKLV